MEILVLIGSLALILLGAEIFTNGIEWLGKKLGLSECAVGSVLAAVGTALPETMVPIMAIFFSTGEEGAEIGIGAILGAPFMLGTLAFFLVGIVVLLNFRSRRGQLRLNVDLKAIKRDLSFFLVVYLVAILASFLKTTYSKNFVVLFLIAAYSFYVYITVTDKTAKLCEKHSINPLFLARRSSNPSLASILWQIIIALVTIILGAKLFVNCVQDLAQIIGVPSFILALVIAPIATELPEKFNSIIWIKQGKDTLAMGNITGAMVFQSSLIPALGILLTPWNLTLGAFLSAVLVLVSTLLVYLQIRRKGFLSAGTLLYGGGFYMIFILLVMKGLIR